MDNLENISKRIQAFKERPVFYIDFDNTLWNTQKVYVETYNKLLGKNENWENNTKWDFSDICTVKPYKGFMEEMFNHHIWNMIKEKYIHPDYSIGEYYYDGATDFVNQAVSLGDATVLTVGGDWNIINKAEYINRTLNRGLHKLYVAKEEGFDVKGRIDMSDAMIIEDRSDVLNNSNALYRVRFGKEYDWNRNWKPDNVTSFSCETWADVKKLTERLMK